MKNKQVNGWEIGIPILQVVFTVVIYFFTIALAFGGNQDLGSIILFIIFITQLFFVSMAFRLYKTSASNEEGVKFTKLGLMLSFLVPGVLLYIFFFFR